MTREPIYAALFSFFQGLTTGGSPAFKTATRRLQTWDQVQAEDSPALLMQQRNETAKYTKGLPTIWTINVALYVYVHTGGASDTTVVPSELLNPLLDLVQNSLTIDNIKTFSTTLGGLVSHCAIAGSIETFQGDLGDEEVAIIPIEIVVSP